MWSIYKTVATALWMVVAALLAFNVAVIYALPPRQLMFTLALACGAVVLISLNWHWVRWRRRGVPAARQQLGAGEPALLGTGEKKEERNEPPITVKQPADEKLTPDQAREWLDDFLVQQQTKK